MSDKELMSVEECLVYLVHDKHTSGTNLLISVVDQMRSISAKDAEISQLKRDGGEVRELFEIAKTSLYEEEQDNKRLQEEVKRLEAESKKDTKRLNGLQKITHGRDQELSQLKQERASIQAEAIEELIKEHSHDYDIGGIRTDAIKVSDANKFIDQLTGNKG